MNYSDIVREVSDTTAISLKDVGLICDTFKDIIIREAGKPNSKVNLPSLGTFTNNGAIKHKFRNPKTNSIEEVTTARILFHPAMGLRQTLKDNVKAED